MRTRVLDIQRMKEDGTRIAMLTAYDYTAAQIADGAGVPAILVGDSLGMVMLGHSSTLPVTLDEMVHHTRAVARGSQHALIIGDMPFLSYTSVDQAFASAGRFLQEGGAQAIKLEGGSAIVPIVRRLVETGIPVMGHLGFTPQSVNLIGTRVQGRQAHEAYRLLEDALELEQAGIFALVLELVPAPLAAEITSRLRVPTIGIGAGPECDGQVQVWHDVLGLYTDFEPRHTKRYASIAETMGSALKAYVAEVQEGVFPTVEHSSTMDEEELQEALSRLQ